MNDSSAKSSLNAGTKWSAQALILYFIITVSFFDTMSQLPIVSPYAKQLGSTEKMIGLIVAAYSFANMITNGFAGYFIDRFGRKIVLVISMILVSLSLFLYSVVVTPQQFFLIRILHGISGGFLVPAVFASVGDRAAGTANRGSAMAKTGIAITIAALFGPPYSGMIKDILGYNFVFYSISALFLFTAIFAIFFLKETYVQREKKNDIKKTYRDVLKRPTIRTSYLTAFFLMFAQGILALALPLYTEELGLSATSTGILFSGFALAALIMFMLPRDFLDRLFKRQFTSTHIIIIGLSFIFMSLLTVPFFTSMATLFISMLLYGIGFGLIFPSINTQIVDNTEQNERGTAFGFFYAFFSLGVVLGPITVSVFKFLPVSDFHVGSIFVVIGLVVIFYWKKKHSL